MNIHLFSNLFYKRKSFIFVLLIGLVVSQAWFLFPKTAEAAQNYDLSAIEFSTQLSGDNFFRTYVGATLEIPLSITLNKPDKLEFGAFIADGIKVYNGQFTSQAINSMSAGIIATSQNQNLCRQLKSGYGLVQAQDTYLECDFPVPTTKGAFGEILKGTPQTVKASIPINSANLSKLGLTADGNTKRQQVLVYPVIDVTADHIVLAKLGRTAFLEIYPNKQEYDAHVNDVRPADVGNNGTSTGTGEAGKNTSSPAGGLIEFLARIFVIIAGFINSFILYVFGKLVVPLLQALLSIRTYTDQFSNVIYPGWEILRNLANIFFIVGLIFIALATLFRLPNYNFRHMLVDIIIAALLVNFSLVIGQAILGVADTVQNQFLPNNENVIKKLSSTLMLESYINANYAFGTDSASGQAGAENLVATFGPASAVMQALFVTSTVIVTFLVFVAIGAFLVVRMVMLWILLMLSPVPYFAKALPFTEGFTGEWWGNFIRYAFFTPIMAFFLNMAAIIAETYPKVIGDLVGATSTIAQGSSSPEFSSFVIQTGSNILLLVFLVIGIEVADKFGIIGGNVASTAVETGIALPFVATGAAAVGVGKGTKYLTKDVAGGFIQRKYNEKTADLAKGNAFQRYLYKGLHLPETVKAFRRDSAEQLEESKELTKAAALSVKRKSGFLGFDWQRPGEDPLALYNEHRGKELYQKAFGGTTGSEQEIVENFLQLRQKAKDGDLEAQLMTPEYLRNMAKDHNLNEALLQYSKRVMGIANGLAYTKENVTAMINHMIHDGSLDHEIGEDFMKRVGKIGYDVGDFTLVEMTRTDDQGKTHVFDMEWDAANNTYRAAGSGIYENIHQQAETMQGNYQQNVERLENQLTGSQKKLYENAKLFAKKREEGHINLKKKKGIIQLDQFWESQITNDAQGQTVLAESGKYTYTHLTSGHEYIAGRDGIPDKVKEKILPLIVKNRTQLRKTLKETLVENARAEGVKLVGSDLEEAISRTEYENLRLAYMALKKDPKALDMFIGTVPTTKAEYDRQAGRLRADLDALVK